MTSPGPSPAPSAANQGVVRETTTATAAAPERQHDHPRPSPNLAASGSAGDASRVRPAGAAHVRGWPLTHRRTHLARLRGARRPPPPPRPRAARASPAGRRPRPGEPPAARPAPRPRPPRRPAQPSRRRARRWGFGRRACQPGPGRPSSSPGTGPPPPRRPRPWTRTPGRPHLGSSRAASPLPRSESGVGGESRPVATADPGPGRSPAWRVGRAAPESRPWGWRVLRPVTARAVRPAGPLRDPDRPRGRGGANGPAPGGRRRPALPPQAHPPISEGAERRRQRGGAVPACARFPAWWRPVAR
jgi:translation initiation factor IF-2